jgi:hypothetical protein
MNDALLSTAAVIALAGGARTPVAYEQVCNFIFMRRSAHDIPATTRPADVGGVGTAFIALGATTPYWLEKIANVVLTYPWDRTVPSSIAGTNLRPGQLRRSSIDS